MTRTLTLLIASLTLTLLAYPVPDAEACSIASDYADPPADPKDYDAAQAPVSPTIVDAYVSHRYESQTFGGCGGGTCGDIHGLNILIEDDGPELLRITHEDGSEVYARTWSDGQGIRNAFLPGYAEVDGSIALRFATISREGYPSGEIEYQAENQEDNDPSCSAGGKNAAGMATPLLLLLGFMALKRRRD
jgi:uncharacterized protein (TIGR03382 family)